jgi:UDPglucose 6-dehydrogenase
MRVCVVGLWHLGSVTAACLASRGHQVVGFDESAETVAGLAQGVPPLFEPGLAELTAAGLAGNSLTFTTDRKAALEGAEVVWVTYDTPVDENDVADVTFVTDRVQDLFEYLPSDCVVLISSQLPVGTTKRLAEQFRQQRPGVAVGFACSPENLRLGGAIKVFMEPDRIVVGCDSEKTRQVVSALLTTITDRFEWMSIPSAEMVKHATNAFLATSVSFINEIAILCEQTGANAREVERGLKSESRIGPRAYLSPGGAFAGGTLARDIAFLGEIAGRNGLEVPLLSAVPESNLSHQDWPYRRLVDALGRLQGRRVAVWGLTYKPGTSTLRRSSAIGLCQRLAAAGVSVVAFDPLVTELPVELRSAITLHPSPDAAARQADALVIATVWPGLREISMPGIVREMASPIILDANGAIFQQCAGIDPLSYFSVGMTS